MAASVNDESKEAEHLSESDEEYTDDDDDEEEESSIYEAVGEFAAQEPGDLNLKVGDILSIITKRKDGWWIAENEEGETGLVPSTYLKLHTKSSREDADSPRDMCDKDNVHEEINNANHSSPMLLRKYEDDAYSIAAFLYPKLSSSGLFFFDLEWDDTNKTLKPRLVKCQQIITLVECRYVPTVKPGI
ncbi:nephrocystin-1-like [Centruroides sculpturatus]|uniref:nephrocystin-1-like n=1 Tax=Centruroides sculpturatus TaxID=218467 RepID=UPI000C6DE3C5|nr:nephrocystin-1-like [Centruroides sculpturatus]